VTAGLESASRGLQRFTIEKLAPTGEGIVRTEHGTGFVAGALPGEDVEAEVTEVHKRFWKGRAVRILSESADRYRGPHQSCAGCDWAHLDLGAARRAKHDLFLETMARLGGIAPEPFGELPVVPSPVGYRLRARFHAAGRGDDAAVGYYAPGTHRVEPAVECLALSAGMRELLPRLREAIAGSGACASEISIAEGFDGPPRIALVVVDADVRRQEAQALSAALADFLEGVAVVTPRRERLAAAGSQTLWLTVAGHDFPLTAGAFFQVNRFLVARLFHDVAHEAAAPPGLALDAFGGVGLFAGALLEAGHRVVSLESNSAAAGLARDAKKRWDLAEESAWRVVHSAVLPFLRSQPEPFDIAVADPPREGLGAALATLLADRVRRRIILVSCEPATLARDLAVIQARGWRLVGARLYDLFALTHRVEAAVTLERLSRA
jgi:tRNA/tmRNA/rRNA uracil-C5-methylase (TrmA/RlmC/RlmD family)